MKAGESISRQPADKTANVASPCPFILVCLRPCVFRGQEEVCGTRLEMNKPTAVWNGQKQSEHQWKVPGTSGAPKG